MLKVLLESRNAVRFVSWIPEDPLPFGGSKRDFLIDLQTPRDFSCFSVFSLFSCRPQHSFTTTFDLLFFSFHVPPPVGVFREILRYPGNVWP